MISSNRSSHCQSRGMLRTRQEHDVELRKLHVAASQAVSTSTPHSITHITRRAALKEPKLFLYQVRPIYNLISNSMRSLRTLFTHLKTGKTYENIDNTYIPIIFHNISWTEIFPSDFMSPTESITGIASRTCSSPGSAKRSLQLRMVSLLQIVAISCVKKHVIVCCFEPHLPGILGKSGTMFFFLLKYWNWWLSRGRAMVLKSMPLRLASDGFVDKLATPKAYVFVAYISNFPMDWED